MTNHRIHVLPVLGLALVLAGGCSAPPEDPAPPPDEATAQDAPPPPAVWTVTDGMDAPESTFLDLASDSIFVSVMNGEAGDRDGNGYIARLSRDGDLIGLTWAPGLNAPKGSRRHGNTLWVADIDEVVGIDIATGSIATRVKVPGAQFLNDLATGPDGTIYTSDSTGNRIYSIKDGKVAVFAEGDDVEVPNGLLVDGTRLVVGSMRQAADPESGPGRVFTLDLATKAKTVLSAEPIGAIDGVESDGHGGYIVTYVFEGRVMHVDASGAVRMLLDLEGMAADLAYDAEKKHVIVPSLFGNTVAAYDVSAVLE